MAADEGRPQPFSKRHGHTSGDREITIWEDAPEGFRFVMLQAAMETCDLSPSTLRNIVCRVLRVRPDPSNWSMSNVWGEVEDLVHSCAWFRAYDIAEAIADRLYHNDSTRYKSFAEEVNECLRELGVGWQLKDALIQARAEDSHEEIVADAVTTTEAAGLATAQSEIQEAMRDLSRRPEPDLSGAVQHAMAALECVARQVTGDPKLTLGELIKKHPGLLPKPLDEAVAKAWGYASEHARHGREERTLSRAEAQLVVGLSAVVSTYLLQKANVAR